MAIKLVMMLALILVMTGIYFAVKEAGWQFALGGIVGMTLINCYVRWKHGFWPGG
jgi:hypothetical protein